MRRIIDLIIIFLHYKFIHAVHFRLKNHISNNFYKHFKIRIANGNNSKLHNIILLY